MARIRLGDYNQLEVVKEVDFGMYLDAGDEGEVLLPKRYVPKGCKLGDMLNVFLYLDHRNAIGQGGRVCLLGCIVGERAWRFFELGTDEGPFLPLPRTKTAHGDW